MASVPTEEQRLWMVQRQAEQACADDMETPAPPPHLKVAEVGEKLQRLSHRGVQLCRRHLVLCGRRDARSERLLTYLKAQGSINADSVA